MSGVVNDKSVRIETGQTLSSEVDIENALLCGVFIPENFTGTKVTVRVARQSNSDYVIADDGEGNNVELPVDSTDRYVPLKKISVGAGYRYLKLEADQAQIATAVIDLARLPRE